MEGIRKCPNLKQNMTTPFTGTLTFKLTHHCIVHSTCITYLKTFDVSLTRGVPLYIFLWIKVYTALHDIASWFA